MRLEKTRLNEFTYYVPFNCNIEDSIEVSPISSKKVDIILILKNK